MSARPVHDYLTSARRPGVSADGGYVVLPRAVIEQMPLPVQQQLAHVLHQVHQIAASAPWPIYRVQSCRWARLNELDEAGLQEAGIIAELDLDGVLVHRNLNSGVTLSDSDLEQQVLVTQDDPLMPVRQQQPPAPVR
ncbi:hypothetical protein [Lentzea sp. NBRC 102530]|uniref:hypothetical protein n=1 Tax=Lentzea sp. NBRC 102530 TaxID=3032201 RepID=UPI00255537CD|nr:hypothetical protein [Lentzea sp. NBRC 102530]